MCFTFRGGVAIAKILLNLEIVGFAKIFVNESVTPNSWWMRDKSLTMRIESPPISKKFCQMLVHVSPNFCQILKSFFWVEFLGWGECKEGGEERKGGKEGKGREGKGREGKGREGKGREGKGREGKGREGKGREGKGKERRGEEEGNKDRQEGRFRVRRRENSKF
jgi:hypothetical protein